MARERDKTYSHVLKYTGIFGGVQGLNILVSLVRNKCAAVLLGPEGMGLASLFNSVQGFLSQSTNLGISSSAIPRLSELYNQQDEPKLLHQIQIVRLWSFVAAVLGFFLCLLASPLIDKFAFSWGNHTLHFALLAPSVAMLAIIGGEMAILKATRRLASLAIVQVISSVASLFIAVPLYYFFWQAGIVPVIVLTAFAVMVSTLACSYHYYPLRIRFSRQMLREGAGIVKLGIAFIVAGAFAQAAEVLIRSFMNNCAQLDVVGFYNAGYSLTVFYAAIVFSSVESDYFPRLSAVSSDIPQMNLVVNRQIEVLLLMISPMLVTLMVFLPVLVPLLYSSDFNEVVPMAQVSVIAMYMKAISLPICYIPLAKKDSKAYLTLELLYYIYFVLLIVFGFRRFGLFGTGVALVLAHVAEVFVAGVYAHFRYSYQVTGAFLYYAFIQLSIGIAAYAATWYFSGMAYWLFEGGLIALSTVYSLYVLHRKASLWAKLTQKVKSKFFRL